MMKHVIHILMLLAVAVIVTSAPTPLRGDAMAADPIAPTADDVPTGSPATKDNPKTRDENGNPISCDALAGAKGGVLLGKIVPCLVYTIEQSTIRFAEEMVDTFRPILYAFLTLVVVLFGARMLSQEPEIHKQGLLLLIKIAFVALILSDLGNSSAFDQSGSRGILIPSVYKIMNESQQIVVGAINSSNLTCEVDKYRGENTPQVWATMDCIMGKIWGFTTGEDPVTHEKTPNMLLVSSFFGLMTGFFFGGAWGVVIFFAMLGVLFTVFMLVVRSAVAFITSYLTICLLLILSPLLLPLAFLRVTKDYFEHTWKIILASFLTPVMISAYSMMGLIIYDKILFDKEAGIQKLFEYEKIKDALLPPRQACSHLATGDRIDPSNAVLDALPPTMRNFAQSTLSGGNDLCSPLTINAIDKDKIPKILADDSGRDESAVFKKMFSDLIQLVIIAFLLNEGLGMVQSIIPMLIGKRSAVVAGQAVIADEGRFARAGQEGMRDAIRSFQVGGGNGQPPIYKSGSEFLSGAARDIPGAMGNSIRAFMNSMSKTE